MEHLRLKFYHTFNCTCAKSKAANSEMVTIELLKSYGLPFMLYAAEAVCCSSANIRVFDSCINRAIYRIFGVFDSSSLEYVKVCVNTVNLNSMAHLIDRKHCKFIGN